MPVRQEGGGEMKQRILGIIAAAGVGLFGSAFGIARADDGKPLIIGGTRLLHIRTADTLNGRVMTMQNRVDHVQDVFAKHLGGQTGRISWKKIGERVHLYLNGDFVLAVTPTDARLNGYKGAARLAPVWVAALNRGFRESNVRPTPGRP